MRELKYLIPLKPISWKRAGVSGAKFYDLQVGDKIAYGLYLSKCHGDEPLFEKAIELDIVFYMFIATQKKKQQQKYHSSTPDLDNLIKLLLDAIVDTKAIISDDRIIASINAKKMYDDKPRTEFTIREL